MSAAGNVPLVMRKNLVKELDYVRVIVGSLKMEEPISNREIKRQVIEVVFASSGAKYMFRDKHSHRMVIFK